MIMEGTNRRLIIAVVSLVLGGILIAIASIGISIALDKHLRAQADCRADARSLEFEGVRVETNATTNLIEFAIAHPDQTHDQIEGAIATYHEQLTLAQRKYAAASDQFETC
jgi:hypothetical protein